MSKAGMIDEYIKTKGSVAKEQLISQYPDIQWSYIKSVLNTRIEKGTIKYNGSKYTWVGNCNISVLNAPNLPSINYLNLYLEVEKTLRSISTDYKINDLSKYYSSTDKFVIPNYQTMDWRQQVFSSMAFHAQNGSIIDGVVQFLQNYETIKSLCLNFDCEEFLKNYGDRSDLSPLNCNDKSKHNYKNSNQVLQLFINNLSRSINSQKLRLYVNCIFSIAYFLSSYKGKNKTDFFKDVLSKTNKGNTSDIIEFFARNFECYGKTLPYDLLKELDNEVFDFVKPDTHINDFNKAIGIYTQDPILNAQSFESIVKKINESKSDCDISNYKFDKMVWLICTQKFYLDKTKRPENPRMAKRLFLESVSRFVSDSISD